MMDDWGWGGWVAGCLAIIVVVAAAAAVFFLLLRASEDGPTKDRSA